MDNGETTTQTVRIGDYEIETILGDGGVTETYLARHVDPSPGEEDRRFAFKLLREDRGGGEAAVVARFRGAAERGLALEDPELVRVVAVAPEGVAPAHYVTELVDGADCALLVDVAPDGRVDPAAVASIGAQVARVLASLHDREPPVVHGGLAPGNVLVGRDGVVMVADVGLAAALRSITEYAIERYHFVAPELLELGAEPTPASDLYSLGAVLCFLLTGAPPAVAETLDELRRHLSAGPPALAGVPESIAKVVRALLASDPKDRPRSAATVALSLTPKRGRATTVNMPVFDPAAAANALESAVARALDRQQNQRLSAEREVSLMPLESDAGSDADMMGFANAPPSRANESMFDMMSMIGPGAMPGSAMNDGGTPSVGQPALLAHLELPPSADRVSEEMGVHLPRFTAGIPLVDPSSNPSAAMLDVGVVDLGAPPMEYGTPNMGGRPTGPPKTPRMHGSARAPGKAKILTARNGVKVTAKPRRGRVVVALAAVMSAAMVALKMLVFVETPPVAEPRAVVAPKPAQPVAAAKPRVPVEPGKLTVVTTPAGATVWIDGEEKGRTPLSITTKPGGHRIVIVKSGFKMLREVADTTESATLKRTLAAANANFNGQVALKVQCKTEGKYPVFIDGRDTGILCPAEGLMIQEGQRLIGVFVIPQNKLWNFEREILQGAKSHRVMFNY